MRDVPDLVLIGAGGHARVLVDALRAAGFARSVAALDRDESRHGAFVLDVPIVGDDGSLDELRRCGTRAFAVALGNTRADGRRATLFERASSLGLQAQTIVHPRAIVSAWAHAGAGSQILAGAVVNATARLGQNVIVNTAAVVEHDCTIGDHVHIATGARLAGGVTVGEGALIGAGAVVLQLLRVGAGAVVGAGALVVRDVAPATVVVGVPAREVRA